MTRCRVGRSINEAVELAKKYGQRRRLFLCQRGARRLCAREGQDVPEARRAEEEAAASAGEAKAEDEAVRAAKEAAAETAAE